METNLKWYFLAIIHNNKNIGCITVRASSKFEAEETADKYILAEYDRSIVYQLQGPEEQMKENEYYDDEQMKTMDYEKS